MKPAPSACHRSLLETPFLVKALLSMSVLTLSALVLNYLVYTAKLRMGGRSKTKTEAGRPWDGRPRCQGREGHTPDDDVADSYRNRLLGHCGCQTLTFFSIVVSD